MNKSKSEGLGYTSKCRNCQQEVYFRFSGGWIHLKDDELACSSPAPSLRPLDSLNLKDWVNEDYSLRRMK